VASGSVGCRSARGAEPNHLLQLSSALVVSLVWSAQPVEPGHNGCDGFLGPLLHVAISVQHLRAKRRKVRTAACLAAHAGFDERIGKVLVERWSEQPRAYIAHADTPTGSGNRTGFTDSFQQFGFARPNSDPRRKHDAKAGVPTGAWF
jgi:hypothetical protein